MQEVFIDAVLDSLKILAVLVVCNIFIALIEPTIRKKVKLNGKLAPLIGVSVGLLPQCGFSIVATDLYQKRHITVGTLLGVYIATSDEALPIFLANPDKALHILPLLALKFVLGLAVGYLADLIYTKSKKEVIEHLSDCDNSYEITLTHSKAKEKSKEEIQTCDEITLSCSNLATDICKNEQTKKAQKKENAKQFLLNPLLHSLEIFIYVLIINLLFSVLLYYVGQDKIIGFLQTNRYIAPLISVLVGAIPNCASSVIISELYLINGLGFGATLGGLCMNAGLGFVMLLKNTKQWKENVSIIGIMFLLSISIAYIFSAIFNFGVLNF